MLSEKFKFSFLVELFSGNFWLKLISLIIAIVLWLYLSGEIVTSVKI